MQHEFTVTSRIAVLGKKKKASAGKACIHLLLQLHTSYHTIILSNVIYVNFIRYSRVILVLKLHMKIVFSSSGKPRKPQRLTPTFEPEVWPDKTTEETSWEDKLTPRCHCFKKSFPSWASVPCCCQKSPCEQPQQSAPRMRQMEEELQPARRRNACCLGSDIIMLAYTHTSMP